MASGSMLTLPPVADAQPAGRAPRVGYLSALSASDPQVQRGLEVFRQALRELGYVQGQSVAIEYRWAERKSERLPELATELVRLKVDVIVTAGGVPPGLRSAAGGAFRELAPRAGLEPAT